MGCQCASGNVKQPQQRQQNYKQSEQQKDSKQQAVNKHAKPKLVKRENTQQEKQAVDIYQRPQMIVEMAYKEESKFIQLVKEHNIKDITLFIGFEANLVLKNGKKVQTKMWNPLTFSLVLGRENLFKFIINDINFNLKQLLTKDINENSLSNQVMITENRESEAITQLFQMMVDNESPLVKVFLNQMRYLIKNQDIKNLITIVSRNENPQQYIEILLQSKTMKTLYYSKVKSLTKYKQGFEQFFEKYLYVFTKDQILQDELLKQLSRHPYNVGFNAFLLQKPTKCMKLFGGTQISTLISRYSSQKKDFPLVRLGKIRESDIKEIERGLQQEKIVIDQTIGQFVELLRKQKTKCDQMEQKVILMLTKTQKGDLSGVKSCIGTNDIPKKAITLLTGLQIDNLKIRVESLNEDYEIETLNMNALELASAMGHFKILKYFVEELNLKSQKDFQLSSKGSIIEQMSFILCPIFRKDKATIQILLSLSHLWTYQDFEGILQYMKTTKWFEGIELALNSKTAFELFLNKNLTDRFQFIRDLLELPLKNPQVDQSLNDSQIIKDGMSPSQQSQRRSTFRGQNSLSMDDKVKLTKQIKDRLTSYPYTGAFLFYDFVNKNQDPYDQEQLPQTPEQKLNHLKQAIQNVTDKELHDYIFETRGSIEQHLRSNSEVIKHNYNSEDGNSIEKEKLKQLGEEIEILIEKIVTHPTYSIIMENQVIEDQIYGVNDNQI